MSSCWRKFRQTYITSSTQENCVTVSSVVKPCFRLTPFFRRYVHCLDRQILNSRIAPEPLALPISRILEIFMAKNRNWCEKPEPASRTSSSGIPCNQFHMAMACVLIWEKFKPFGIHLYHHAPGGHRGHIRDMGQTLDRTAERMWMKNHINVTWQT